MFFRRAVFCVVLFGGLAAIANLPGILAGAAALTGFVLALWLEMRR